MSDESKTSSAAAEPPVSKAELVAVAYEACVSITSAGYHIGASGKFPYTADKLPEWADRIRAALDALTQATSSPPASASASDVSVRVPMTESAET